MTLRRSIVLLALAPLGAFGFARDDPAKSRPSVDDEEKLYQRAQSRRVVEENCLICHSGELIEHQRLTPKQWSTEVEKMIGWGAPLPTAEAPGIAAYLAEEYPKDGPPPVPDRRSIAADLKPDPISPTGGDPKLGAPLFAAGCANCHGPGARGAELGPNLVEKPAILDGSGFAEVVLKGRRRMPASETVLKPGQVEDILAWLRTLR